MQQTGKALTPLSMSHRAADGRCNARRGSLMVIRVLLNARSTLAAR